jgi:hypothetical protein
VKSLETTLDELAQWAREELAARRRTIQWLERQEAAVIAGAREGLEEATRGLASELGSQAERALRRQRLFARLAAAWKLPATALSLSSVIERGGASAQPLSSLRDDLRASTAEVLRRNRRIAALVRMHRRVVDDLIHVLVEADLRAPRGAAGQLVDAEAW